MDDKCHVILFNKEVVLEEADQVKRITLDITGMGCIHCANRVHNSLIDHPGIVRAEVSHMTGKAEVIYIPTKVDVSHLIGIVAEASDNRHSYKAALFETAAADEYCNDLDRVNDTTPATSARTLDP